MTTAKKIQQMVSGFPDDYVFVASDLQFEAGQREAATRALQRMAKRGEISKLSNGRYFKPRMTMFGALKPSPYQIIKEYLLKEGRITGYLTGGAAFSEFSLTTQINSEIQIGTNRYRRPLKREGYIISFIFQPNPITADNVELLRLLDCIRLIKRIPATTPDEACKRLISSIGTLYKEKAQSLGLLALKYAPFVRALLGAAMEIAGFGETLTEPLRQSLNGISKYRLPISDTTLPNKQKWRIYETA